MSHIEQTNTNQYTKKCRGGVRNEHKQTKFSTTLEMIVSGMCVLDCVFDVVVRNAVRGAASVSCGSSGGSGGVTCTSLPP